MSLVDKAYEEIKKRIVIGEYLPGNLLSENELASKYNMSRTPIRGAISRLESEGMVTSLKNRGILVREFTYKEYFDMKDVINSMHFFVMDFAIEREYFFDLQKLRKHLDFQLEASQANDYPSYVHEVIQFERTILEACHNQMMLQTFDSFTDNWMRMAIVNWKLTPNKQHYTNNKRNEDIYNEITSRNFSKVKQLIKEANLESRQRYFRNGSI